MGFASLSSPTPHVGRCQCHAAGTVHVAAFVCCLFGIVCYRDTSHWLLGCRSFADCVFSLGGVLVAERASRFISTERESDRYYPLFFMGGTCLLEPSRLLQFFFIHMWHMEVRKCSGISVLGAGLLVFTFACRHIRKHMVLVHYFLPFIPVFGNFPSSCNNHIFQTLLNLLHPPNSYFLLPPKSLFISYILLTYSNHIIHCTLITLIILYVITSTTSSTPDLFFPIFRSPFSSHTCFSIFLSSVQLSYFISFT